mmetsp:Transcript_16913/g.30331  ORF Transcript_16913/g.30331 Transcript_16913/m.30331 type:complete len:385 (+) Transcript_16913:604-1758(+)
MIESIIGTRHCSGTVGSTHLLSDLIEDSLVHGSCKNVHVTGIIDGTRSHWEGFKCKQNHGLGFLGVVRQCHFLWSLRECQLIVKGTSVDSIGTSWNSSKSSEDHIDSIIWQISYNAKFHVTFHQLRRQPALQIINSVGEHFLLCWNTVSLISTLEKLRHFRLGAIQRMDVIIQANGDLLLVDPDTLFTVSWVHNVCCQQLEFKFQIVGLCFPREHKVVIGDRESHSHTLACHESVQVILAVIAKSPKVHHIGCKHIQIRVLGLAEFSTSNSGIQQDAVGFKISCLHIHSNTIGQNQLANIQVFLQHIRHNSSRFTKVRVGESHVGVISWWFHFHHLALFIGHLHDLSCVVRGFFGQEDQCNIFGIPICGKILVDSLWSQRRQCI